MNPSLVRWAQYGAIVLIAAFAFGLVILSGPTPAAHALPEYAERSGEPCATCHVSPGGGGPRTLRGLLWAARGRPDQVPVLPNVLIAPGVTNGLELYDVACSACHGQKGEGLFGATLADTALRESKVRSNVLRGRERSGMPAFEGQFTEEQLDVLVNYVAGVASGQIEPPPDTYPLPPGRLTCGSDSAPAACGGN
ncbi:MAG: Cytochrome c6 [Anaerolineales bacterium]|nr:Cytochrome c6 [Anaerolineales bacterium]